MDKYPGNDAAAHNEFRKFGWASVAGSCVYETAVKHVVTSFSIQTAPVKRVIATEAFAINALTMAPASNKITVPKDASKALGNDEYCITLPDEELAPKLVISKPQGVEYTSVIWKCRIDSDIDNCNCKVIVSEGVYKHPGIKNSKLLNYTIEVVTNFKAIAVGEEVIIYKPAPTKPVATMKPVMAAIGSASSSAGPASKKQRKS
jgi:hypothetical protein